MKRANVFLGMIIFTVAGLSAQTISLEQVRTLALANSRSLAKSNLAIQSVALEEKSRVYSNLPSLSLGASASMTLWSAANAAPVENPVDTFSAGASVSVSQRIFEGGKSNIQKAINQILSESARKDALAEFFTVLDSADSAYYAVLEAAATLEAEESSLQTSLTSLSIAEVRQASGMLNQGDYLKVLAEKEARENSRNQARRNLALSITKLKAIIGLSSVPDLEQVEFDRFEDLILRLGNVSDTDADSLYNQLWVLLAAANPSLAVAGLSTQRAEKNLSMAKTAYSPTLSASFSTGLNYTPDRGMEMSAGRVSLSASIPVDYWVIANNVEKSRLSLDQTALDYSIRETALETELQSTVLNALTDAGSVLSSRRALEYAKKHFEFVMERYRLAQSSVSDLEDASILLINSRNSHTRARYGFLQSLSKLRSLCAIDDEDRLVKLLMGNQESP